MPSFVPTLRELVLLAALLVSLLVFAPKNRTFDSVSPRLKVDNAAFYDEDDSSSQTSLAPISKYPEPQLAWREGDVPETAIVQHTPGMWRRFLLLRQYVLTWPPRLDVI